jgi:hypothetical protein
MESGLWVRGMAGAVRIGGGSGGRTRWGMLSGVSAVSGGIGWDVDAGIAPAAAILGGEPTEPRSPGDGGPNVSREGPGVLDVLCAVAARGPNIEPLGVAGNELSDNVEVDVDDGQTHQLQQQVLSLSPFPGPSLRVELLE